MPFPGQILGKQSHRVLPTIHPTVYSVAPTRNNGAEWLSSSPKVTQQTNGRAKEGRADTQPHRYTHTHRYVPIQPCSHGHAIHDAPKSRTCSFPNKQESHGKEAFPEPCFPADPKSPKAAHKDSSQAHAAPLHSAHQGFRLLPSPQHWVPHTSQACLL